MKTENKNCEKGFTLIELLVVIAIIGILASTVLAVLNGARGKAYIAATVVTQRELQKSVEIYSLYMGFYPPDVERGWDPGLAKPLPYNLDTGEDCNTDPGDCPVCTTCPGNWVTLVQNNWKGPYISRWPPNTPWGGEYDYNYWPVATDRYGCIVPAGIYVGAQGDYVNAHTIPPAAEQDLLNKKLDADNCLNGESEILLYSL